MRFDKFLEHLKNGIKVELEDVDITDEFKIEYEEYQERAKKREELKNNTK